MQSDRNLPPWHFDFADCFRYFDLVIPLSSILKNTRLCAAGLFLLTMVCFWSATGYGFLTYDDPQYVYENDHVKEGLTADSVKWAFLGAHDAMWHPVTSLSHLLDVQLFGMNPRAHHAVNLVIHAVNVVLLYLWLLVVFKRPARALLVAVLFAWHPLRVESVVWISERKDVLCTLFTLLTLHAYVHYVRRPGRGRYALVLLAFALGIMAKPMIVMLPLVLLLLDWWPLQRLGITFEKAGAGIRVDRSLLAKRMLEKAPLFALSLMLAAITYKVQQSGAVLGLMPQTTLAERCGNAVVSYVRYLGLLVWPLDLSVLYPYPGHWPWSKVLGGLLVLSGVTFCCWRLRRTQPWWLLGWFWFLVSLIPVIGLIQAGGAALANRYTYFTTVGLLLAVVWSLAEWAGRSAGVRRGVMILSAMVAVVCVLLTTFELPRWHDTGTLFRQAIRVTGDNPVAHMVLGSYLLQKKQPEAALEQFVAGLQTSPTDAKLHLLAGRACLDLKRNDAAIQAFHNALKLDPNFDEAQFQLARADRRTGQIVEARSLLERYLQKHPDDASAWNNLGGILAGQQDLAGARKCFERALALEPEGLEARKNLIRLYALSGHTQEALSQLQEALKIKPDDADLWYQTGLMHEQIGERNLARSDYQSALKFKPDGILPMESLAWLLLSQPEIPAADARSALEIVEKLLATGRDRSPTRWLELHACALAANGRFAEALSAATQARERFLQKQDDRAMQRIDSAIQAYQQSHVWVPVAN